MKQRISTVTGTVIALVLLVSACVPVASEPAKEIPTFPAPTYNFSYSAEPEQNPLDVAIALIRPRINMVVNCTPPSEEFAAAIQAYASSMARDFEGALVAKNYGVTGPYDSIQDMTFGAKENAILAMQPVVEVTVACTDGDVTRYTDLPSTSTNERVGGNRVYLDRVIYQVMGSVTVQAHLTIEIQETFSEEKVFQRNINVADQSSPYEFYVETRIRKVGTGTFISLSFHEISRETVEIRGSDGRGQSVANALSAMFPAQLSTFSDYFDWREIEIIVGDAERARDRTRF